MKNVPLPQDQANALVKLYQAGQMIKTEHACMGLLQAYPHSLFVLNILGAALSGQGKSQEAIQTFNRVIQLNPDSADAYSNRGNILTNLGRSDEALRDYDKAIQIKPSFAKAHTNRGNLLKDLGQLDEALLNYDKAIQLKPDYAEAYSNRGNALLALGRYEEALPNYGQAIQLKPDFAEAYCNRGAALERLDRHEEALPNYDQAIQIKPDFAYAYYNRGAALEKLDRHEEALPNYDQATQIKPDFAEAYCNRGNILKILGRLDEALLNYDKAIQIKPDYSEAYSNRGTFLQQLDRHEEALPNYDQATRLKPDFADAYYNRGVTLQELGRFKSAMKSYQKAVSINPNNGLFWAGYASSLQGVKFKSYNDELGHYLLQVIEQPTVRPREISIAVINALQYHPVISRALALSKSDHINEDIGRLAEQLSTVPLLLRLMELSSIADSDVEKMLSKIRQAMLHKAASGDTKAHGLTFFAALALHCFTNEYVYFESKEEKQELQLLQENVKHILKKEGTVSPTWIVILGAYRPLYSFSWADALRKTEWPNEIKKVIVTQVDNVREEQALCSKISCLNSIDDKVSRLVRDQYEENPYPRWIKTALSDNPKSIIQVLQSNKLHLNVEMQQFSNKPAILVAGCGTGQQALYTASRFLNCNVLAIDLSLTSLSYAKRKTQELGIKNIEYIQGDILKLDQLKREFDIIECTGVLHHMDDPLAGWKVLVERLRANGIMKIGLYSQIARQSIANARREIAKKEYTSSPDDIRRYREEIMNMDSKSNPETSMFTKTNDFSTLSECRDLLFHVQECCFTLLQIQEALNDLNLQFLGFELQKNWIRNEFRKLYPEKGAAVSLPLWHQFELKNPETFEGMYQFWVQKT